MWGCHSKGRTKNGDIWEETVQGNIWADKRGSNVKLEKSTKPGVIFSLHQTLFEWWNEGVQRVWHAALMGVIRNAHNIVVRRNEWHRLFKRPRCL